MLILNSLRPLMGIWKIDEPWQEMLKYTKNANMPEMQLDRRKQEWLAVRLLLKYILNSDVVVDYYENGAPFLPNSRYKISISHTKGFVAVILCEDSNPGLDIEYHSVRAWKLRNKYMSENEMEMFASLNNAECISLATICWCAKETAYKSLLQNGVDFIEHLHISPFVLSNEGEIFLKEIKTIQQQVFRIQYQVTDDYIIAWRT